VRLSIAGEAEVSRERRDHRRPARDRAGTADVVCADLVEGADPGGLAEQRSAPATNRRSFEGDTASDGCDGLRCAGMSSRRVRR
jgi:hypothetical protein